MPVAGSAGAAIGSSLCRSGRNTGWRCGGGDTGATVSNWHNERVQVPNWTCAEGQCPIVWNCTGGTNQRRQFPDNDAVLRMWECGGTPNQKWRRGWESPRRIVFGDRFLWMDCHPAPPPASGLLPVTATDNTGRGDAVHLCVPGVNPATGKLGYVGVVGRSTGWTRGQPVPVPAPDVAIPGPADGAGTTIKLPTGLSGRLYSATRAAGIVMTPL